MLRERRTKFTITQTLNLSNHLCHSITFDGDGEGMETDMAGMPEKTGAETYQSKRVTYGIEMMIAA